MSSTQPYACSMPAARSRPVRASLRPQTTTGTATPLSRISEATCWTGPTPHDPATSSASGMVAGSPKRARACCRSWSVAGLKRGATTGPVARTRAAPRARACSAGMS